jgi:hypothetical protein
MSFDPYNYHLKIQESIWTRIPKVGVHWGVWGVHSLTLSCTPKSMKCDSRTSRLARTFASPYVGHEPKVRVGTTKLTSNSQSFCYH